MSSMVKRQWLWRMLVYDINGYLNGVGRERGGEESDNLSFNQDSLQA